MREIIRILLTNAAIHGVPIMVADFCNTYLQALTSEKHFIICGPEFGIENIGKKAITKGPYMAENAPGDTFGTTSEAA